MTTSKMSMAFTGTSSMLATGPVGAAAAAEGAEGGASETDSDAFC
jgi:hypothetical protein